jgi:hypothetical protein
MADEAQLREQLRYLLSGGGAHLSFDELINDFSPAAINGRIDGVPYTPWQVLEHMRLAQWDILEFSRNPKYVSPPFPEGYWPDPKLAATGEMWRESVAGFRRDLQEMLELATNRSEDLFRPIPGGDGQTLLRQALLVADHNAYHLGALALMKRILARPD